ncbi:MAG TPA: hypothetical protein DEQ61_08655, partial [Streptomyces sp.]|nr:hypothetical protein [Streptomyces sp.]
APEPEPAPGPAPGGQDATAGSGRNGGPAAGFNGSHNGGPGTGSQADADADEPLSATGLPDDMSREEAYYGAFRRYVAERGDFPNARQFGLYLMDLYGVLGRTGGPLSERSLRGYLRDFRQRYSNEMDTEYIA